MSKDRPPVAQVLNLEALVTSNPDKTDLSNLPVRILSGDYTPKVYVRV